MIPLLNSATRELASFLGKELPNLSRDWWRSGVLNQLTATQQRNVLERRITSLDQLDLAALLRVMDRNWFELSELKRWPRDARNWVKELQAVRNKWAHASSEHPAHGDLYRDADTLHRVMTLIGAQPTLIEEVQAKKRDLLSAMTVDVSPSPQSSFPPPVSRPILRKTEGVASPRTDRSSDLTGHGTGVRSSFVRLVHSDWSTAPTKRWAVEANKDQGTWIVNEPRLVGTVRDFLKSLLGGPSPTLAGFDFPIGIPVAFGKQIEFDSFVDAIDVLGTGKWSSFYDVCQKAEDIALHRPFYPNAANASPRQSYLFEALGV
jgi:hypothetical protein